MNKVLISLFLLVASCSVYATDWYVCPDTQGEYGTEDGTSLANCFDGNADIGWASIDPGHTLYFCGDWLPADARITVADSGTAGNYITLSGLASACGRETNSTISRAGLTGVSGQNITASNTAATRQYIKIEDITLKDCYDACLLWDFSTTGAITDDTALWVNRVTFTNCGSSATPKCMRHTGENLIVENSVFDTMYGDAIFARGGGIRINDNVMKKISIGGTGGDGIQIDITGVTNSGNVEIYGNYIDHSDTDVKYGILVAGRGTANINIHDNTVYCPAIATNATPDSSCHGILADIETATVLKIQSNYIRNGDKGITINGNAAVNFTTRAIVSGNVITGAYRWGILTDGYINNTDIVNNTVIRAGDTAIDVRKNSTDNATAISYSVVNNVMAYSPLGFSYSSNTPSPRGYNNYFGNTADIEADGAAGSTTTGDITTDPKFLGGSNPSNLAGFYPRWDSGLRRAGVSLNIGAVQDCGDRAMFNPPSIGACEVKTRGTVTNDR